MASAAVVAMMGGPALAAVHYGPYVHRNTAINSGRTSILSGNKVGLPISAPINVCGVSIAILGFGDAGRQGGAGVFSSAFNSFGR